MIRVHYSNRTENLVGALVEHLADAGARGGSRASTAAASPALTALTPRVVAVPNADVAAFVKVEVARRAGIASNLHLPFLERALLDCAPANLRDRVLDRRRLQVALLSVLADEDRAAADNLAPVSQYVDTAEDDDEAELRRFQLAHRLSALFVDYSLSRPALLAAWRRGESGMPAAFATTERWQRALWRALYVDGPWLTLPHAFEQAAPGELELPPALHVFGFSYLARAYYRVFERLGRSTDVFVYSFNPCAEYWEDIGGETDDPLLLRRWAGPGRDHTRALNQLTDGDFDARFEAPRSRDSALSALQSDVLARRPARPDAPRPSRTGVSVLACPSVRREAEIIAAEIWGLVESDPTLRFCDVAVLLNPARSDLYQTHIAAAFRAAGDIPVCMADAPLAGDSRAVEAIELLLGLPFGQLGRGDLLRLMTHPAVVGRYADVDPADWLRWVDQLAIVRGADRRDHAGTYVTGDRFNWEQGLRRLALGAFLSAEPGDDQEPPRFELDGRDYLVEPPGHGRLESAARFAALGRSLIADARDCRTARRSLSDWAAFLGQLVGAYIEPADDADERVVSRCRRAFENLAELDVDGRSVPYRIAFELARAALTGLRASRGEPFAEGVVVSTLAPMRSLPFRAVFVAGLGEGEYPAPERTSTLDLRLARREQGDVRPRDRDRYALLETVLAAREHLALSYVARDPQTGEPLEPSPLVAELVGELQRGYVPESASPPLTIAHPLRRYDPAYFDGSRPELRSAVPEAAREASAVAVRTALEDSLAAPTGAAEPGAEVGASAGGEAAPESSRRGPGAADVAIDDLATALPPAEWASLREFLRLCPPPAGARAEIAQVSLYHLRNFLVSPLQASARVLLGLRDDDDDPVTERIDEPFESDGLTKAVLLRQVLRDVLDSGPDANIDELYRRRIDLLELAGRVPTGLFGDVDRARHRAVLAQWQRNLWRGQLLGARFDHVRFGKAQEHTRVDRILPPLALAVPMADGSERRVELVGKTELVCLDERRSLTAVHGERFREEHFLRGFVDQAVLAAAGLIDGAAGPFSATVCPASDGMETRRFAAIGADEAADYLRGLLGELLDSVHDRLLPIEAVMKTAARRESIADYVARSLRTDGGARFSARFGPLRDISRFRAVADAEAVAARRLARFIAADVAEGSA